MDRDVSLVRDKLKTPRAAAVAGVIFSTLLILIDVLLRKSIPANPLGSGIQLIEHAKALSLALRLAPFAGIAFLWFMAVIRDRHRKDPFFATVFLGSGLVYLAMMLVCAAIARALLLVLEAEPERVIQSGAYAIGRASTYEIFHIYAIRIAAVFMTSVSTTMLRTQIGPRVLAYLGYVLALVLLFAVETFDWASLAFPLWTLLVSVLIMIEGFRRRSDTGNESVLVR
jgi:hypothetical protein